MSYRPLELVIQSAQGLKYVNHITRMKPYAVVFIRENRDQNYILHSAERRTSVDSEGGSNPTWNFNINFTINLAIAQQNHLELVVKLKSRRRTHGLSDKDIGEVCLPISDLLNWFDDDVAEGEKHVSRNVVTSDGQEQGVLAFSYRFGRTVDHPPHDPNVTQRPNRGANGFTRPFVGAVGEGLGVGAVGLTSAVGMAIFQPDNEQPDDDNEDD